MPSNRIHATEEAVAEPDGALRDRVEYRLNVGRGAGDHAQDLAGGGLPFERLGQVAVSGLQLLEQADVLDGDDGLVGERFQEIDLRSRERLDLLTRDRDGADRRASRSIGTETSDRNPAWTMPGRRIPGRRRCPPRVSTWPERMARAGQCARPGGRGYASPDALEHFRIPVVMGLEMDQARRRTGTGRQ